jgi:predicted NBD/HSP70 family sugar kinase
MANVEAAETGPLGLHGARLLPEVEIDTYNEELRDADGFIGDRASKRAFQAIVDDWRARLAKVGEDPLGDAPTEELGKKVLDKALQSDDAAAAALVHSAIEEFAAELAAVIRRFLRLKAWQDTERIVIGGGFRQSRVGELALGRASLLLKAEKIEAALEPIAHHPDEAGLIGALHLFPAWAFAGHDAILAVDIGGSNIRGGIVRFELAKGLVKSGTVEAFDLWRHADDKPKRDEAVGWLVAMLEKMIARAKREGLRLAPFIGIGCPGIIDEDGAIERGGQNLPGNWESSRFNLPREIRKAIPRIEGHATVVLMHNDAVVQGLCELPRMREVERWGVLTIGTGLGNARFTRRKAEE